MKFQKLLITSVLVAGFALVSVLQAGPAEDLFADKCGKCHKLNGEGKDKGPDLTGIAGKRSAAFIKAYVADPAAASKQFPDDDKKRDTAKYPKQMPAQKKVTAAEIDTILGALK